MFRIRFGQQVDGKNGKRPEKLTDAIRVTADNPDVIDAFNRVYGGERQEWKPDPHRNEFETYLPTRSLRIVLIPGQSLTQWWEKWKRSVCERRCDSITEQKSGGPCKCTIRDPALRTAASTECNPVTRVHVLCPDVEVIGAGMFVCNGLLAAQSLPESIANADAALRAGFFVPATLTVVEHRGLNHFIVPRIDTVGVSMFQMLEQADGRLANGELVETTRRVLGFTPMELEAGSNEAGGGPPPLRTQLGQVDHSVPPAPRANAAQPIPPTGMAPRPVAGDPGVIDVPGEEDDYRDPNATASGPSVNHVAIWAREAGLDDDGRHLLAEWASDGATASSTQLDDAARERAYNACQQIRAGQAHLARDEAGGAVLIDGRFGWPTDARATISDAPPAGELPPFTMEEIDKMNGPRLQAELRERELERGGTVPEMRARLAAHFGLDGSEPM